MKMIYLPKEIVHIILEYDGRIRYRKGIYTNQINVKDNKYYLIRKNTKNKILALKVFPCLFVIRNGMEYKYYVYIIKILDKQPGLYQYISKILHC
jgi:hypothetical protein